MILDHIFDGSATHGGGGSSGDRCGLLELRENALRTAKGKGKRKGAKWGKTVELFSKGGKNKCKNSEFFGESSSGKGFQGKSSWGNRQPHCKGKGRRNFQETRGSKRQGRFRRGRRAGQKSRDRPHLSLRKVQSARSRSRLSHRSRGYTSSGSGSAAPTSSSSGIHSPIPVRRYGSPC